ncbi:MAG: glycerate kinase [Ignavibacteria bacterium]
MKKILIAPNSFKGCADSVTISNYFKKNLTDLKDYEIIIKPVSDGGDGFLNVCRANLDLKDIDYFITTPFDESVFRCSIGYDEKNKTIYIESAKVLGLNLIPAEKKNPALLRSKGLGDLMKNISADIETKKIKADIVIIGIGGTGTNDLGLGAASRFGLKLLDSSDKECDVIPDNYSTVKNLEWNKTNLPFKIFCVIDVENPLAGDNGASMAFAKQKGASDGDIEIMEKGFINMINIFSEKGLIKKDNFLPGAGGGLAAGLSIFFNAKIVTAEDFIMKNLRIEKLKNKIDCLITGEGSFDSQSIMKKGTWILIQNFQNSVEKIFLCCGIIEQGLKSKLNPSIISVELSKFFNSEEESLLNIEKGIKSACNQIKRILHIV